jgi:type I restriction enzyme S subunit
MTAYPQATLGELSELVTKGTTPKTLGRQYVSEGIPFLRGEDVRGAAVDPYSTQYAIDQETHSLLKRSQILPGDLLITIAGTVGRVGYIADDAPPMNCNQAVAIVRLDRKRIDLEYACYACQSPNVLAPLVKQGTTATITNLSLQQVR